MEGTKYLLCFLPQQDYFHFPRTREWEAAAAHYRERFAAYVIRPRDIFLQPPKRRLYMGSHVQEFLARLYVE